MYLLGPSWGHAWKVARIGALNQVTSPKHKTKVMTVSQVKAAFKAC